jgi:EAL domain-containing protein (putative c-di-GMP-specific phosphodiesterase class I)
MYDAKQSGRPLRIFDPSLDTNSPGRLALVTHLRQAVEAGEIEIHLQPLVSLETGELLGAEALARWQHATRGFVPPDEFIPLAERSGLIRPLTDLVLSRAIAACAGWQRTSPGVGVSVNISARSLGDETLVEVVDRLLPRHGLPAELLTLEITESSIMADPLSTIGLLHQLQHRGVRISVDDFGTGYSSLSYLRRLPVTEVKIDKSFVQRMNDHGDDRVIVHSIADLAKNLGLSVVAEGVEDEQTWRLLSTAGCHVAQGYLVSRPLPVEQFRRWGAEYRPRHYPIARVI